MFPSKKIDLRKLADDNSYYHSPEAWSKLIKDQQKPFFRNFEKSNNPCFDFSSLPVKRNTSKATDFHLKGDEKGSAFASSGIVKDFTSRSGKKNDQKIHDPTSNDEAQEANDHKLSTTERIRMAGQQFISSSSSSSSSSSTADEIIELNHPFSVPISGLSDDEAKDIELLLTLLASAEKTGQKEFNRARKLIQLCSDMSLKEGNPVERLVYYFSEAIHMKINHEIGRLARNEHESMRMFDLQEALVDISTCIFSFHLKVPLSQVCLFISIHTIIENLEKARKIHIIDLEIRTGMQYILMMQAIASRSEWHVDYIKITAISTRSEAQIKDTCKRLADFAKSMNIPFSAKVIMVADVLDFNVDLIELDDEDEKVIVYARIFLSTLIVKPNSLEYLMSVIREINPCVTVITEVEANHTSPAFVNRFIEALFFYGALFDSMSDCLADDDVNRKVMESVFYGNSIRNIVAADGDDRTTRHIGIDVWRKFFQRFGMLEMELSDATMNETKLMMGNFNSGNSCSLLVDGGCFLVGWKGIPIFSVSAWKFI